MTGDSGSNEESSVDGIFGANWGLHQRGGGGGGTGSVPRASNLGEWLFLSSGVVGVPGPNWLVLPKGSNVDSLNGGTGGVLFEGMVKIFSPVFQNSWPTKDNNKNKKCKEQKVVFVNWHSRRGALSTMLLG